MSKRILLVTLLLTFLSFSFYAQNFGAEIVSKQKFGQGLMVVKAQIVPISGTVSNMFFFNRADKPWNGNVWYEYDWEIRGKFPKNGWSQIRVRNQQGGKLKDAPVNISTSVNLGNKQYHYILIRKGNTNISNYNYKNASAHGGNSKSLIVGGPRIYNTGGSVANIPTSKQLDFSLGITAFDNGWAGKLPSGDYSGDYTIDFARFYTFSGNKLNSSPKWKEEFNGNNLDQGKWQIANWKFSTTQFTGNNIRFNNGNIIMRVSREQGFNNNNVAVSNLAPSGQASQSSTAHGGNASRAIDKNLNGKWNGKSVTHTNNQSNAWWKVKLAQTSRVDRIVVFNRTDNCCRSRLSNFTVSVLDDNGKTIFSKNITSTPNPSVTISTNGITGRTVQVKLNNKNSLSLAEVQVFGVPSNNLNSNSSRTTPTEFMEQVQVFPNPTTGKLFVNLSDYTKENVTIGLFDLSGKEQFMKDLFINHYSTIELDLSNFKNGFYFLYIKGEKGRIITEKISLTQMY